MAEEASLIPGDFLFRFAMPLRYRRAAKGRLSAAYRLPEIERLGDDPYFAEVRAAWNPKRLQFAFRVRGRGAPMPDYEEIPSEADFVRVWIDTRATHNIHRASRFCHSFIAFPYATSRDTSGPAAFAEKIHRAKDLAVALDPTATQVDVESHADGYTLQLTIESTALVGFDPREQPRLGFFYALRDTELGFQLLTNQAMFPFDEDPSLWSTLELQPQSS